MIRTLLKLAVAGLVLYRAYPVSATALLGSLPVPGLRPADGAVLRERRADDLRQGDGPGAVAGNSPHDRQSHRRRAATGGSKSTATYSREVHALAAIYQALGLHGPRRRGDAQLSAGERGRGRQRRGGRFEARGLARPRRPRNPVSAGCQVHADVERGTRCSAASSSSTATPTSLEADGLPALATSTRAPSGRPGRRASLRAAPRPRPAALPRLPGAARPSRPRSPLRLAVRLHHGVVRRRIVVDERPAHVRRDARRPAGAVERLRGLRPCRSWCAASRHHREQRQAYRLRSAPPRIHRPASGPRWRTRRAARESGRSVSLDIGRRV